MPADISGKKIKKTNDARENMGKGKELTDHSKGNLCSDYTQKMWNFTSNQEKPNYKFKTSFLTQETSKNLKA